MASLGEMNLKLDRPLMGATVKVNVSVTRSFKARRWLFIQLMKLAVWVGGGREVEMKFEGAE